MNNNLMEMTKYFRSSVAAQSNMGIDFKVDYYSILSLNEVVQGKINPVECNKIFTQAKKNTSDDEDNIKKKPVVNVIICARAIKTVFEANKTVQDEIDELTGIYYIPALLHENGALLFDKADKRLPWFPREYLIPMVEPKLAIGDSATVDSIMSNYIDQIEKIRSWSDYAVFFQVLYESVAESPFEENTIRNLDAKEPYFELENNVYLFLDQTVNSTFHIMNLYNSLREDEYPKALYDNFMSTKIAETSPLIENSLSKMQTHSGQMNGEYPLSPSQREAVNHFNGISSGEILAVNGPPGTGKTTLLQTIVADMYVKRALKKDPAPLIVVSSTNNQAVTNVISSFGNIKKLGISNLEERWIEGVNSFAVYFPSSAKIKEAKSKGYQYTNQKGEFFVSDIEDEDNIEKSKIKLITSCNKYFSSDYKNIDDCQAKLHKELEFIEQSKNELLSLAQNASQYDLEGETIDKYLQRLLRGIEEKQTEISNINQRICEWKSFYKKIPCYIKCLDFIKIKRFTRKIQTEFRLFINNKELRFLNEYMTFDEIQEKYSHISVKCKNKIADLEYKKMKIEEIKNDYDCQLEQLQHHNIDLHGNHDEKYNLDLHYINGLMDKKHRYMAFWLSVHYYECKWLTTRKKLTDRQKNTNFKDIYKC